MTEDEPEAKVESSFLTEEVASARNKSTLLD
jgi:hypothetical protein